MSKKCPECSGTEHTIRVIPVRLGASIVRATEGSTGYDLKASIDDCIGIPPGQMQLIPAGVSLKCSYGVDAQVRPRSGLAKKGVFAIFGTIDSDYTGEVCVNLYNSSNASYCVRPGDRIGQLVFCTFIGGTQVEGAVCVQKSPRGDKGFGSTGK